MPNEQRAPVQYRQFEAQRLLPDGLLAVQRPRGEVEQSLARSFAAMGDRLGRMADDAAASEGRRAGLAAGMQPEFRPSRSNTIRGRAYDEAGVRNYMLQLESSLREDMWQLYEQHKDDPTGFTDAASELKKLYRRDHVFTEIAGDFDAGFERLADAYRKEAGTAAETRLRDERQASFLAAINAAGTRTAQTIASVEPGNESGAVLVSDALTAELASIDAAVADDTISAAEGERLKQERKRDAAIALYSRQGETITDPTQLADYRQKLADEFAAGKLPEVDAEAFGRIDAALVARSRRINGASDQAARTIKRAGDDIAARIIDGGVASPDEITGMVLAAKRAPAGDRLVQEAFDKVSWAEKIRDLPIEQAQSELEAMQKRLLAGEGGAREAAALKFAAGALDQKKKLATTDPIGAAVKYRLTDPAAAQPIPMDGTGDQVSSLIRLRQDAAEVASREFGVLPRLLRPGEARDINRLMRTDPNRAAEIAGGLIAGAGPYTPVLLRDLGNEAPELAQAGRIMWVGGSPSAAVDVFRGASKDADGRPRPRIPAEVRNAQTVTGSAMRFMPDDRGTVIAAAENIARARLSDAGADMTDEDLVSEALEQAIQDAAGRTIGADGVARGGFHTIRGGWWFDGPARRVLLPADMTGAQFEAGLDRLEVGKLQAAGLNARYSQRQVAKAWPIATSNGYALALGSEDAPQLLESTAGKPFILPVDMLKDVARGR